MPSKLVMKRAVVISAAVGITIGIGQRGGHGFLRSRARADTPTAVTSGADRWPAPFRRAAVLPSSIATATTFSAAIELDGDADPSRDRLEESLIAARLREVRLDIEDTRRTSGLVLLAGGLLSTVGGLVVVAVGHDDDFWLPFGLGTAGWGSINALLSLGLLDLGGSRREQIEADAALRGEALAEQRETTLRAQHGSAAFFALNLGLDVAYIGTAVVMFLLADHLDAPDDDRLRGYSIAQLAQGTFLFAFDLVELFVTGDGADAVADIPVP